MFYATSFFYVVVPLHCLTFYQKKKRSRNKKNKTKKVIEDFVVLFVLPSIYNLLEIFFLLVMFKEINNGRERD